MFINFWKNLSLLRNLMKLNIIFNNEDHIQNLDKIFY